MSVGTEVEWVDGTHTRRTGVVVEGSCRSDRVCVVDDRNRIHLHPRNIKKVDNGEGTKG